MGWIIVSGRGIYGMYMDEGDAREVHRRVGGTLMTTEEYARYAQEQNAKLEREESEDSAFAFLVGDG